jgi:hypothetical protein
MKKHARRIMLIPFCENPVASGPACGQNPQIENLRTGSHTRIGRNDFNSAIGKSTCQLQSVQAANRNWSASAVATANHFVGSLRHRGAMRDDVQIARCNLLQDPLVNGFCSAGLEIMEKFFPMQTAKYLVCCPGRDCQRSFTLRESGEGIRIRLGNVELEQRGSVPENHCSKAFGPVLVLNLLCSHCYSAGAVFPAQFCQFCQPLFFVELFCLSGKADELGHFLAMNGDHYFLSLAGQFYHLRQFRLRLSQSRGHVVTVVTIDERVNFRHLRADLLARDALHQNAFGLVRSLDDVRFNRRKVRVAPA